MPVFFAVSAMALRMALLHVLRRARVGAVERAAHPLDAHVQLVELGDPAEQLLVQPEDVAHLGARPHPVLGGEPEHRQPADVAVTATRTSRARFSSPSVCPSVRGSCARFAQRPLPSMMHATCTAAAARSGRATTSRAGPLARQRTCPVHVPTNGDGCRVRQWASWELRRCPNTDRRWATSGCAIVSWWAARGRVGGDARRAVGRPARRAGQGGRPRRRQLAHAAPVRPATTRRRRRAAPHQQRSARAWPVAQPDGDGRARSPEAVRRAAAAGECRSPSQPSPQQLNAAGARRPRPGRRRRAQPPHAAVAGVGAGLQRAGVRRHRPGSTSAPATSTRRSRRTPTAIAASAASTRRRHGQPSVPRHGGRAAHLQAR